jgi:hypothetical protein
MAIGSLSSEIPTRGSRGAAIHLRMPLRLKFAKNCSKTLEAMLKETVSLLQNFAA